MEAYHSFPIYINIPNPIPQAAGADFITYNLETKRYYPAERSELVTVPLNELFISTEKSIIPYISNFEEKHVFAIDE